jgi:hypothetical protein
MARNSSQSPRAKRSSTDNAEKYNKGEVRLNQARPASVPSKGSRQNIEAINSRASKPRGK